MRNIFLNICIGLSFFLSHTGFSISHFSLPWMNSETNPPAIYQSSQYLDAVWVIETFFLTCPYCNDNAQNVNDLQNDFKNDERVQILDVGIDTADSSYQEWIRKHQPNHPVLKDASRKLVRQLGTGVYPSTYVLDKNLNIVFKSTGVWGSKTSSQIKEAVEKALNK